MPALSQPPPHAPAHGWRKKNDPYYVGYTGRQWERDFLDYLEAQQPEVLLEIRTKKALDDDLTGRLKAAIAAFKTLFVAD